MKAWIKLLSFALLSFILLAGCGTGSNNDNTSGSLPNTDKQVEGISEKEKEDQKDNTDGESETEKKDPAKEEGTDDNAESEKIRLLEQNLTYQVSDGEKKEDTAFLKESEIQNYSLYILSDYEFTAEEPGKDVIYFKENGHHFMRVEILPGETDLEVATNTIKDQLTTVNETISELESKAGYSWLNDAKIFEAENTDDKISAFLIEKDGYLIKLMIFSKVNENHEDPFLKMAETIELN